MTRREIENLNEAELVELATREIALPVHGGACQRMHCEWSPLTDYNDTMTIVQAMKAKGWHLVIDPRRSKPGEVEVAFVRNSGHGWGEIASFECKQGSERDGILRAALLAER